MRVTYSAMLMWLQPVGGQQAAVEVRASASQTLPESSRPVDFDVAIQNNPVSSGRDGSEIALRDRCY